MSNALKKLQTKKKIAKQQTVNEKTKKIVISSVKQSKSLLSEEDKMRNILRDILIIRNPEERLKKLESIGSEKTAFFTRKQFINQLKY